MLTTSAIFNKKVSTTLVFYFSDRAIINLIRSIFIGRHLQALLPVYFLKVDYIYIFFSFLKIPNCRTIAQLSQV